MDNSSYRSQYISSLVERDDLQEKSANVLRRFWDRLAEAEQKLGRPIEDGYSEEEYLTLMKTFGITNANVFRVTKSRIMKYLKWMRQREAIDQEYVDCFQRIQFEDVDSTEVLESKYFRDFRSLQDTIQQTLWSAKKIDDGVFSMQISLIYLAWCGIPMEDALRIKKEDVTEDHILAGGRTIKPNGVILEHILQYRDAKSYSSQARGVLILSYKPSEYLFRSPKASSIDAKHAGIALIKFGKSGNKVNPFQYEKIYWSGIFNRAYIHELGHGEIAKADLTVLETLFQEKYQNPQLAHLRLKEYQNFRNYFYPSPSNQNS